MTFQVTSFYRATFHILHAKNEQVAVTLSQKENSLMVILPGNFLGALKQLLSVHLVTSLSPWESVSKNGESNKVRLCGTYQEKFQKIFDGGKCREKEKFGIKLQKCEGNLGAS